MTVAVNDWIPADLNFYLKGQLVDEVAEGEFCSWEPRVDHFSEEVGATGSVVRTESSNKLHDVKLVMQQTAKFNKTLSQLAESRAVFDVMIRDKNSADLLFSAAKCWIKKKPKMGRAGDKSTPVEWMITAVADVNTIAGTDSEQ